MQPSQSEDIKVALDIKQEPSFKFEEDFPEEEIFVQDDPGFRIEDLIGEGSGDNVGVSKTEDTIKAQTSAESAKRDYSLYSSLLSILPYAINDTERGDGQGPEALGGTKGQKAAIAGDGLYCCMKKNDDEAKPEGPCRPF
ncbi:hypothetical protein B0J13DRAFT_534440 [Dactylonectria estremocensis]|uniref:Uncharacterized protein n=1 Tax=Dactylonectria estremocensis TaxID=1079267 RepID=A0A9P9D232_9HYPO|nr:hypothetical protein B0J13DRAFT_534440 [Dactylonectria estremocensis]